MNTHTSLILIDVKTNVRNDSSELLDMHLHVSFAKTPDSCDVNKENGSIVCFVVLVLSNVWFALYQLSAPSFK